MLDTRGVANHAEPNHHDTIWAATTIDTISKNRSRDKMIIMDYKQRLLCIKSDV